MAGPITDSIELWTYAIVVVVVVVVVIVRTIKVNFSLEEATKAQRRSKGIVLLFL
jgi:hypothetical protein